jgi:hypothetical protein
MTSNPLSSEEKELSSDIFGVSEYAPETPKKKDFLPWHKPRKQFVRQKQWCEQVIKMIDEVMPENNVLKYFGLPGDDLLDLRYFHQHICEPRNLRLKFLGFNHGANTTSTQSSELNISLDEVSKLPFIDPTSGIIGDDVCQIANNTSIAWDRSVKMGPYDIINIDLCDGFGKHPHDQFKQTHYNSLMQLMTLQARRLNPWLLLLTTRTGSQHIDGGIFEILKNLYEENLNKCSSFQQSSSTKFSISDIVSLNEVVQTQKGLSDVFLISLCKWVASIATSQIPPAKVEVKSVIGYKVDHQVDHQDLISLVIRIDPTLIVPEDKIGLATQQRATPDECTIAVQVLNRIANTKDADKILSENPELMNEMIATSSSLLEEARYDVTYYEEWAKRN